MLSHIIGLFPRGELATSENFTPSEEVEKGTNFLYDMDNTKFTEKLDPPERNDSVTPKN